MQESKVGPLLYVSAGHIVQLWDPTFEAYVPSVQSPQAVFPMRNSEALFPTGQLVQEVDPVTLEYLPEGQLVQPPVSSVVSATDEAVVYVPASHEEQILVKAVQYLPAVHVLLPQALEEEIELTDVNVTPVLAAIWVIKVVVHAVFSALVRAVFAALVEE